MKRTIALILGLAVVIAASAAFADDQPASSSTSSTPSAQPAATTPETPAADKAEEKAEKPAHHHHAGTKMAMKHTVVDLNSAAKEDLSKLPGLSDDLADKIIAARPFKSKRELVAKKILTRAEYKKIAGWVTAKQEAAAK